MECVWRGCRQQGRLIAPCKVCISTLSGGQMLPPQAPGDEFTALLDRHNPCPKHSKNAQTGNCWGTVVRLTGVGGRDSRRQTLHGCIHGVLSSESPHLHKTYCFGKLFCALATSTPIIPTDLAMFPTFSPARKASISYPSNHLVEWKEQFLPFRVFLLDQSG